MRSGNFILVKSYVPKGIKGWFTLGGQIQFWTKLTNPNHWTHTAQGIRPYGYTGEQEDQIFEALELSVTTLWKKYQNDPTVHYRVYQWNDIRIQQIFDNVSNITFHDLNHAWYGFAQLLFFVWRGIVEMCHLPKRRAKHNPFPGGRICTEDVDKSLRSGSAEANKTFPNKAFEYVLNYYYDINAVTPGDIENMLEELRKVGLMTIVEEK